MGRPIIDRSGQHFGAWTLIEHRGNGRYLCRCDCGTEGVRQIYGMMHGTSRSCGCGIDPKPQGFIVREFDGQEIRQRNQDGYFDATEMCRVGEKKLSHWNSLQSTTDYLNALSRSAGIPADRLLVSKNTGQNEERGSWIHPRAAMRLAQWISPEFAVLVDGWVLDLVEGRTSQVGQKLPATRPATDCPEADVLEELARTIRERARLEQQLQQCWDQESEIRSKAANLCSLPSLSTAGAP